jgi:hypothetical protein
LVHFHYNAVHSGDNPVHCTAFKYSPGKDEEQYDGLNMSKPCCWTGQSRSVIPDHLKGIVTIDAANVM